MYEAYLSGHYQLWLLAALVVCSTLLLKKVYSLVARQLFKRRNGCTDPPRRPQKFFAFGSDFLKEYNGARIAGVARPHMDSMLFSTPGRTTSVQVSGQTWLFTSDSENIKSIWTNESDTMAAGPSRRGMANGWLGEGMFMSDGRFWKQSRNMFKPMFSRLPISNLKSFEVHASRFFSHLPEDGATVDLQPLFKRLFLDTSTEIMLGESANSLTKNPNIDIEDFEAAFQATMIGSYERLATKLSIFSSGSADKAWKENYQKVHAVFDGAIERAIAKYKDSPKTIKDAHDADGSMLQSLLSVSQDKVFLRDQLLNVFIGAKDTASIGVEFMIFHLARAPRVYKKLREEVASIGDKPITFELLKSMKYLQAVMNESLRLLSPVNIALRNPSADCVLPHGGGPDGKQPIFVPKNTRIEASLPSLHRDPEIWGDKAKDFMPERWLDGLAPKWNYIPFLGGPRMCPAQQMMLTQYGYLLVRFAQQYREIENRDPELDFKARVIFSMESKNGVQVALHK